MHKKERLGPIHPMGRLQWRNRDTGEPQSNSTSAMRKTAARTIPDGEYRGLSFVRRAQPQPTTVFDTYWRFAAERQDIYFRRLAGVRGPWTSDSVLSQYRFTNVYRATDRVSQYLIKHVAYESQALSERDQALRILLFKIFNKIETWQFLEEALGTITCANFRVDPLSKALDQALAGRATIYSAAYIMPSGGRDLRHPRKHHMHLHLLAALIRDKVLDRLLDAKTMESAFHILLSVPTFGPFLSYQFVTDLNYSTALNFSEMEFVVPGPGAKDGIRKCFRTLGDLTEAEVIQWVAERQDAEFSKRGLRFKTLWGRTMQLIDCQNVFCEVDKYARVAHPEVLGRSGRSRIKQKFISSGQVPAPWFPPKWNILMRSDALSAP